jgi:phenylpyruvate tautomerase
MPLLRLEIGVPVPAARREALLTAASKALTEATGKPEGYVMVTLAECAACMAGKAGPAAFADVRGIGGLTPAVNKEISRRLCALLKQELALPADSVYLTFTDVPAANWGWKGSIFG